MILTFRVNFFFLIFRSTFLFFSLLSTSFFVFLPWFGFSVFVFPRFTLLYGISFYVFVLTYFFHPPFIPSLPFSFGRYPFVLSPFFHVFPSFLALLSFNPLLSLLTFFHLPFYTPSFPFLHPFIKKKLSNLTSLTNKPNNKRRGHAFTTKDTTERIVKTAVASACWCNPLIA